MSWKATLRRWLRDSDSYGEDADERFATTFGLRQLADLIEDHPDVLLPYQVTIYDSTHDKRHDVAIDHLRGKARLLGGRWDKVPIGDTFVLERHLGGRVKYRLEAPREAVCEKRIVGHHQVQRRVRPPSYIDIETETVTEPIIEWDCPAVLS